jgi:AGCS family alanine or glycine:cation symporter
MFKLDHKIGRGVYMVAYLAMVMWGSVASLKSAWAMAAMGLGVMTVINIIAIVWLTPTIVAISNDYFKKHESGGEMEYQTGDCEIQGKSEKDVWG